MVKTIDNNINFNIDIPKIKSPFVREEKGSKYVLIDKIAEEYEWVFENDNVIAVEKLDGTSVSIVINHGNITAVYNRKNRISAYNKNYQYITKGILNSIKRGYVNLLDGQWYGELVGPKVNGNPYDLEEHLWIPFQRYSWKHLVYESWGKYPKTYKSISKWFKDNLIPLFYARMHNISYKKAQEVGYVEGIVFTDPETMRMAKIRRDMFDWYHK